MWLSSARVAGFVGLVAIAACAKGLDGLDDADAGSAGSGGAGGASGSTTGTPSSSSSGTTAGTGGASSSASTSNSTASSSSSASTTGASTSSASNSSASNSSASNSSSASSSGNTGAGGGGMCPLEPTNVAGCASCGNFCDSPWTVSWAPVAGATYYVVEYTCFMVHTYQTANTSADLCNEVGMCNDNLCGNGAGPVTVKACDQGCCSAEVTVPPNETPIACGGGVCC